LVTSAPRLRAALLAAAVALAFADASIVVLALPPIYGEFDTTVVGVSWVITSYAVVVAVVGLVLALVRRRRRVPTLPVLQGGLTLFGLASVACGLAPSMAWLIAGRCAQAVGATLLLSGALGTFEATRGARPGRRIWSLAATVGLAIGPALGGVLTEAFDWQAIFLAQAPVALAAFVLSLVGGRARAPAPGVDAGAGRDEQPSPAAAWLADAALVLTSAALVGALFLGVLLVIEVWRYSPVAGAVVVSALPVGVFAVRPLRRAAGPTARVAVGCGALAAGLAALAFLPAPGGWWAAAALAVCGIGFGLVDPVIGGIAESAGADPVRAAARTVAARHAGLVLGLVVIAPSLATDLDAGAERAVIAGADTMLDTRLPVRDKIGVAQAVADLVERTPRGQMPDVSQAFVDAEVAGADADRASAELVRRLEDVLTRSFRRVFLVAASLALLAAVPAMAAAVTVAAPRSPARRPAWIGAAALGAVVAAAGGLVVAEARAGAGDIGEVVEADPCAASADPYSGDGLDPTLQRIALGALNGAACDLGVSRERLVLSLADVPGSGSVSLDRDAIESALEASLLRSIDDADERGSLPGLVATFLRFAARNAPIGWIVDGLDLPERLPA
jgi:predicted MFS family arabinose efflux permease